MKPKTLQLNQINTEDGTQVRALNFEIVEDYREILADSPRSLPPVDVYGDGTVFWLADGFHRHKAAKLAGLETILARVRKGGRMDALRLALGANVQHGYRRTRADKRNAVLRALEEFTGRSDRYYADLCKVSPTYVGKIRKGLLPATVQNDSSAAITDEKRTGRDGKTRKMPEQKRGRVEHATSLRFNDHAPLTISGVSPASMSPDVGPRPNASEDADFESEFDALDKLCAKVVSSASRLLGSACIPQRSRVRSRLNAMRDELEKMETASLPRRQEELAA